MIQISVKSCNMDRLRGMHQRIRESWGERLPSWVTLRFFVGEGIITEDEPLWFDEIQLNCKDDYHSLPFKTREICRQSKTDFLFLCDTDTYVNVERLVMSGFEAFDYFGYFANFTNQPFRHVAINRDGVQEIHEQCRRWASGGMGYFLSKKAATIVAGEEPTSWAEDLWVGQIMAQYAVKTGNSKLQGITRHPWK